MSLEADALSLFLISFSDSDDIIITKSFVRANHVYALRSVRLGAETNNRVPVIEGLQVGERIVTEGSFMLRAEWLKSHPKQ